MFLTRSSFLSCALLADIRCASAFCWYTPDVSVIHRPWEHKLVSRIDVNFVLSCTCLAADEWLCSAVVLFPVA